MTCMVRFLLFALAATLAAQAQNPLTDAAPAGMTDAKALNLVSSGNEHYGNMVVYMRGRGITPPFTVRSKK